MSGELDLGAIERADDSEARRMLLTIRGVGPWSADIYMLMALRRPDIWPDGDMALAEAAKGLKRLKARPSPDQLNAIALGWKPWRSVAARILWHYYLRDRRTKRRS
jgi:DNA-3-methyladenine glycosylase II